jgi:hypothetical protein
MMLEPEKTGSRPRTADFADRTLDSTEKARLDYVAREKMEPANPIADPMSDTNGAAEAIPGRDADIAFPASVDAGARNPAIENQLFSEVEIGDLRSRWSSIQAGFVDEPRHSVEQADQLVATAIQRIAQGFASERATLEKQWDQGDAVSTEDLRVALQRYRAFFGRLLNAA